MRTISAIAALILVAGSCVALKPGSTGYSATWLSLLDNSQNLIPRDNLILEILFDADASDSSGNNYNGSLVNGASVSSGVLSLDGVNDYVDFGDNDDFSFGNGSSDEPFSFSAWVYPENTSRFRILNKYSDSSLNREFQFDFGATSTLQLYLFSENNSSFITANAGNQSGLVSNWTHIVATYNGSTNSSGLFIYINGVDSTAARSGSGYIATTNRTQPLYIGRLDSSYAKGKFDNVRIYNDVLTQDEIDILYNEGHD